MCAGLARIHDVLGTAGTPGSPVRRRRVLPGAGDGPRLLCLLDLLVLFFLFLRGLVLLLLLVLLVGGKGHVHLHFDLGARRARDGRAQDLICEEHLVEDFVVGARAQEELIVDVRVLGGVNSNKVTTTLVLSDCLANIFLVSQPRCLFHRVDKNGEFLGVLNRQPLNHLLKLGVGSVRGVPIVLPVRLQACSLNALPKSTLFAFAVEALHPVLDLVDRFFLSIKPLDSNQVEHIAYQVALDRHIEWGLSGHRRAQVNFDQPWLQVRIDQNVET